MVSCPQTSCVAQRQGTILKNLGVFLQALGKLRLVSDGWKDQTLNNCGLITALKSFISTESHPENGSTSFSSLLSLGLTYTSSAKVVYFLLGVFTPPTILTIFLPQMFFLLFPAFPASFAHHHMSKFCLTHPSRLPLGITPLWHFFAHPPLQLGPPSWLEGALPLCSQSFSSPARWLQWHPSLFTCRFWLFLLLLFAYLFISVWASALQLGQTAVSLAFINLPSPSSHTQSILPSQWLSTARHTTHGRRGKDEGGVYLSLWRGRKYVG